METIGRDDVERLSGCSWPSRETSARSRRPARPRAGHPGGLTAVTSGDRVVLGSVRPGAGRRRHRAGAGGDAGGSPATVRPSEEVEDLEERSDDATILVTRSDGGLVGGFVADGS